jgi:hypothetical protein
MKGKVTAPCLYSLVAFALSKVSNIPCSFLSAVSCLHRACDCNNSELGTAGFRQSFLYFEVLQKLLESFRRG